MDRQQGPYQAIPHGQTHLHQQPNRTHMMRWIGGFAFHKQMINAFKNNLSIPSYHSSMLRIYFFGTNLPRRTSSIFVFLQKIALIGHSFLQRVNQFFLPHLKFWDVELIISERLERPPGFSGPLVKGSFIFHESLGGYSDVSRVDPFFIVVCDK